MPGLHDSIRLIVAIVEDVRWAVEDLPDPMPTYGRPAKERQADSRRVPDVVEAKVTGKRESSGDAVE